MKLPLEIVRETGLALLLFSRTSLSLYNADFYQPFTGSPWRTRHLNVTLHKAFGSYANKTSLIFDINYHTHQNKAGNWTLFGNLLDTQGKTASFTFGSTVLEMQPTEWLMGTELHAYFTKLATSSDSWWIALKWRENFYIDHADLQEPDQTGIEVMHLLNGGGNILRRGMDFDFIYKAVGQS